MKWAKWPFLVLILVAATVVLVTKSEGNTTISGRIFGYYFRIIFSFAIISTAFSIFYYALILERMSADYPDEFQQLSVPRSPVLFWRNLKLAKSLGDNMLKRWAKRGLFWFCGALSLFVTVPLGIVVFVISLRIWG